MPETTFVNIQAMNENKESLGEEKFSILLKWYLEDTEKYLKQIREGLNNHDTHVIVTPLHTIRSSSKQLGAEKVFHQAEHLEMLIEKASKNTQELNVLEFEHLTDSLEEAFFEVRPYYQDILNAG